MSAPTITIRGGDAVMRRRVFDSVREACSTYTVINDLKTDVDMTPSVHIAGGDATERQALSERVAACCIKNGIPVVNIYSEEALKQTDGDLMMRLGMDAQKWAVEFGTRFDMATVRLDPEGPSKGWVDKADLIGWFANAIMAGYDRGREQGEKEERERRAAAIEFGPDIETPHDTMPDWLPFGTFIRFANNFKDWHNTPDYAVPGWAWCYIPAIRLPKGHPLYATKPWGAEPLAAAQGDYTRPISGDLMSCLVKTEAQSPFKKGTLSHEAWLRDRSVMVKNIATLLIPRIDNDGHDLSAEHAALQVELIGLFGGYTATAATGGWRDGLTIYRDELTRYDVAVKAFDTTVERDLQRVAERMARACHQECIMLVLPDGQAICVDAAGGVR